MIRKTLLAIAMTVVASAAAQASGPCSGGSCRVGRAAKATTSVVRGTVRTTTRIATAPVRGVRRVFGR